MKGRGRAFLWLLLIPAQLVLDLVLLFAAAYADTAAAQTGTMPGHPAPALLLAATAVAAVMTLVAAVAAVLLTARAYRRAGKESLDENAPRGYNEEQDKMQGYLRKTKQNREDDA